MQQNLADRFSVHIESIRNWERGATRPSIRHIPKIVAFLGYNLESEPSTLPGRIAYLRRRLGLTQEDLAKTLEVNPATLYRWEKGLSVPATKSLQRIDQLLEKNPVITPR